MAIHSGLVTGSMSKRALQMLFDWTELHREELIANWNRAREGRPLENIDPLP